MHPNKHSFEVKDGKLEKLISKVIIEYQKAGWEVVNDNKSREKSHIKCLLLDYFGDGFPKEYFKSIKKTILEKDQNVFDINIVNNERTKDNCFNLEGKLGEKYDIIYVHLPFGLHLASPPGYNPRHSTRDFGKDFADFINAYLVDDGKLFVVSVPRFIDDSPSYKQFGVKRDSRSFMMMESIVDVGKIFEPYTSVLCNLYIFQKQNLKNIILGDIKLVEEKQRLDEYIKIKGVVRLKKEFVSCYFHLYSEEVKKKFGSLGVPLVDISLDLGKVNLRDPTKRISEAEKYVNEKEIVRRYKDSIGGERNYEAMASLREMPSDREIIEIVEFEKQRKKLKELDRLKEEKEKLKKLENAVFIPRMFGSMKIEYDKKKLRNWEYWYFEIDREKADNKWIQGVLMDKQSLEYMSGLMSGSAIKSLNKESLGELIVPPPTKQKQQIYEKKTELKNKYLKKIKELDSISVWDENGSISGKLDDLHSDLEMDELVKQYENNLNESEELEFKASLLIGVKDDGRKGTQNDSLPFEVVRSIAGMANRHRGDEGVVIVGLLEKDETKDQIKNEIIGIENDFGGKIKSQDKWSLFLRDKLANFFKDISYVNSLDFNFINIKGKTLCRITCPTVKFLQKNRIKDQKVIYVYGVKGETREVLYLRGGPATRRVDGPKEIKKFFEEHQIN